MLLFRDEETDDVDVTSGVECTEEVKLVEGLRSSEDEAEDSELSEDEIEELVELEVL